MARTMTPAMTSEVTADALMPILIAKLEFDGGDVRVWHGLGDLTFGGEVYTGTGDFGSVSPIEETIKTTARGMVFRLSGISSALISIALNEDKQGRPATLWLGAVDPATFALVADPIVLFKGRMDVMKIRAGGKTATIELYVENRMIDLKRPKVRRFTSEDQKSVYPADTGLDKMPGLMNKKVVWGRSAEGSGG